MKSNKPKLLVRIMKCSGHPNAWYNSEKEIGQTYEVYLERDCYLYIEDTDVQRYVVAEDYDIESTVGIRGLIQSDCVILKILTNE